MKRALKWLAGIAAVLILLAVAAVVIVPRFVDLNRFKAPIEQRVAEVTGRPFALGGIRLSLFPRAGIVLEDLHLGNPPGFSQTDFASIRSFELQVELLPLLSKNLAVERFVVDSPRIFLAKNPGGRANWGSPEGIARRIPSVQDQPLAEPTPGAAPLPIRSLAVGDFEIRDGALAYLDEWTGESAEVTAFNLRLADVSLDRPIEMDLSAQFNGKPLTVTGRVGPVGREVGRQPVPLDLQVAALDELRMQLFGHLETLAPEPRFALKLNLEPFSPRKLMAALGREFPLHTADPAALGRVSLKADLTGTARAVSVSDGVLALDDTTARFSLQGKEFDKPHLVFDFALDTIDADRYLPAKNTAEAAGAGSPGAAPDAAAPRSDNNHLRRPVLDGLLRIGTLKMHGARIQDLSVKVGAEGGRYRFDPLSLNLYGGSMGGSAVLDVRGKEPRTGLDLKMERIQAGPLLVDVMRKDVLEGSLNADVALSLAGDAPDRIKASLNGKGRLQFNDGAIKGIDLAGMARNVQAAFGLAERPAQRPRTDFSELKVPFTLSNGLFQTPETVLASPFLRLTAAGTADLVREQLDFRVEPKLVATIKGQGDTAERAGLTVPILVSGTFSNPIFRPDLEGMARQRLQEALTDPSKLKETLQGDRQSIETLKEQGRQLLKGFGLGN